MPKKNIAILVETSLNSGRQIVRGISRFARERNDWSLHYHTGPLGAMAPGSLENWQGDGIIARIANPDLHETVKACQVPVVDVLGNVPGTRYPVVKCDEAAISALVGNHFKERGFRNIAFFGLSDELWSLARRQELAAFCRDSLGTELSVLEVAHQERASKVWANYIDRIQSWIAALPKPVGVMIASDQFGPDVLAACQASGLSVPDQVSLVGVDNDLPFCEICQPQLSSVEPNHELIGYEAARVLDCILERNPEIRQSTEVSPRILHVRPSSDATALEDPALVKALRFIRANACDPISVDDIARASGVSRSVLQRRFRSSLKQTVLESILTVRVNRAKEMLATTSLPLPDLAERCGFRHQEYLGFVFKKRIGCTPGQYRIQHSKPR
ncbi:XylR family transcriptional regulator [Pelagicoccus sp. SDUM812005]|uniref:AraC family transcriptional regulator n=1 Tax=Pelagicoccus sp. SDUM812005 TaxID=3041257 RepID=UPI00280D754B|nr:XylR family transcriptional regulator [Pelagicoccus sp. SDUM812005]MDQ8179328.1 XylR family transcriptional regulator [Pelagicoccus sp. SDUM812005]